VSWIRLDDGFTINAKVVALSDGDFRVWLRLLCHCAKSSDPTVDSATIREVSGLNSRRIQRYFSLDLLDVCGESFIVHDWASYQPKFLQSAERMRRWRANRDVTSDVTNGVTSDRVTHARAKPVPSLKDIKSTLLPKGSSANSVPSDLESETESLFAITQLLAAVKATDDEKARLRAFCERSDLAPFAFHSTRDELAAAKQKGTRIKSECAYVRRIIERYVQDAKQEPDLEP